MTVSQSTGACVVRTSSIVVDKSPSSETSSTETEINLDKLEELYILYFLRFPSRSVSPAVSTAVSTAAADTAVTSKGITAQCI